MSKPRASFFGTIFGAMVRNALQKNNYSSSYSLCEATPIQESYAHRSTQVRRRKIERRMRG